MAAFLDLTKHHKNARGVAAGPRLAVELRRVANLFLVSGVTLVLFVARAVVGAVALASVPEPLLVVWGLVLLTGWAVTLVFGVYVTFTARRWGWLALCAFPFTSVPGALAYAWVRRREIERDVLEGAPGTGRRERSGRGPRD